MLLLFALATGAAAVSSTCSCGFKDPSTGYVFTESIIAYFNESGIDSEVFASLDYQYRNQKGSQITYPQGASPANLQDEDTQPYFPWENYTTKSLEMYLDAAQFDHHSVGAELRTIRQDILYGTFRASMRSSQPWVGGSAMSMYLQYNDSNSLEMDMLNMDNASDARITQLVNGEAPLDEHSVPYSVLKDPWSFVELRFDWTDKAVDFFIGTNRSRSATLDDRTLPSVPQPLFFSHWSTGDQNYMQGPPPNRTVANVQWIRAFFNSSLTDHEAYDKRCATTTACSIDDMALRGSSDYQQAATIAWEDPVTYSRIRVVAGIVAACFSSFGVASLLNAFFRRTPWHKIKELGHLRRSASLRSVHNDEDHLKRSASLRSVQTDEFPGSGTQTPAPMYPGTMTPLPGYQTRAGSITSSTTRSAPNSRRPSMAQMHGKPSLAELVAEKIPEVEDEAAASRDDAISPISAHSGSTLPEKLQVIVDGHGVEGMFPAAPSVPHEKTALHNLTHLSVPDAMTGAALVQPSMQAPARIDYLAGLVAISCLFVTLRHFSLTFWPYATEPYGNTEHFQADPIIADVLASYFLSPLWIGPFFVTSCRFLVQRYLRTGKLDDVANKMLLRAPRMLIPCFIFITLEYFLISLGLTSRLEWAPSVTYSTWPSVTPQPNFGVYLNNMIELAYLIPNAAPEVISHYCVGILWTIPVQLQFSFVTLLAGVMIKDVKRPWKRLVFYTVTILAGWYANSWSACHWLGLLLADADITYGWIKWTQARWYRLYPVLFIATVFTLGTPFAMSLNNNTQIPFAFMAWENAIHPDPTTGRPMLDSVTYIDEAYPIYYQPSLAVLTISVGLQVIVELSTWVQAFLSSRTITFFHPHIMTVYLLHGFVFWSLGAYIIVALSETNVPYWGSLLITAICCYSVILLLSIIITPLTDFATKGSTKNIWRWATEVPVPHRATTAPFNKALIIDRTGDEQSAQSGSV